MRRYFTLFVAVLWLMTMAPIHTQAQQWQPLNGPYGAPVDAMVRTARGTLLAATYGGLFRSENSGLTWTHSGVGIGYDITRLAAHPDGNVIARTQPGQLIFSTDDGRTWTPATVEQPSPNIICFTVASNGAIYGGALSNFANSGGIYRSTDRGESWSSFALDGANVTAILVDTGGIMIAGIDGYGDSNGPDIHRSSDSGRTWKKPLGQGRLYAGHYIPSLAIDSGGKYWMAQAFALHHSTDRGLTWDSTPAPFLYPVNGQNGLRTFTVAPNGDLLVGTTRGIYRSTDNGMTWISPDQWPERVGVINFTFDVHNNVIFAGTDIGVMASTDNGITWEERNEGITASILDLAVNGSQRIIAITPLSTRLSTDGGKHWKHRPVWNYRAIAVGVSPTDNFFIGYHFYYDGATPITLERSTDDGDTWTTAIDTHTVFRLGFNVAGTLFAVVSDYGIRRSNDNGRTWDSTMGSVGDRVGGFAFDSTQTGYVASEFGLLRTSDNGATWIPTSINGVAHAVAVDRVGTAYVAVDSAVYRSTDRGVTWIPGDSGREFISLAIADSTKLLGISSDGIAFQSIDGGDHWASASTGLPDSLATALATGPEGTVYAGARGYGIYRWMSSPSSSVSNLSSAGLSFQVRSTDDAAEINLTFATSGDVRLWVINSLGQPVATIFVGDLPAGVHRFHWDADGIPSGMYFITLLRGGQQTIRAVPISK